MSFSRIQHNIPAMNAYRNYAANTSAVAKNLEKLASGYRINRAGDDAAGLAISEKMRIQITGLEQAQSNAKSGINLIQTAEGALTEVHDMLKRMYTLAEQSANGTYDNDVDRAQLQKELNSLRTEVDRIADSTNYNGINLLDGSLDGLDKSVVKDTTFSGMSSGVKKSANSDGNTPAAYPSGTVNTEQGLKFFTHQEGVAASKTSFEVDLSNLSLSGLGDAGQVKFELGLASSDIAATDWMNNSDNHDLISTGDSITAVGGGTSSEWAATITADSQGRVDGAKLASELVKALGDKATVQVNGVEYKVSADGDVLKFNMTDDGFKTAAADTTNTKFNGNFNIAVAAHQEDPENPGTWDQDVTIAGMTDNSTSNIHEGNVEKATQLADLVVRQFSGESAIRDGSGIKLGGDYYVFAGTDETLNAKYSDNVKVVDIRDLFDADKNTIKDINELAGVNNIKTALTRLTEAAEDNEMWSVELSSNGDSICLREKESYSGDADLTTLKGLQAQVQKFTKAESNVDTTKATGKALTLQIGDTAESFNKMSVNVSDMHAKAMGIADVDISTQEGAAAALEKIKAATNYVSDVRGDLGALQNRLDHTINNLSVAQENIQDAESNIRDVDVAKEMMQYTKNNILVQSAQAMLAQANQLPQGVLQLLQ